MFNIKNLPFLYKKDHEVVRFIKFVHKVMSGLLL